MKRILWRVVASVLLLVAAGALTLLLRSSPPLVTNEQAPDKLIVLHTRCVQEMVANTCRVMGTGSKSSSAAPGELVFVAGVGPVDAVEYQKMYLAGEAMCFVVKDACIKQWDGAQCLTARKLWGIIQ